jgi:hypothetical protein
VERDFVQRALKGWSVAAKRAVSAREQIKFQQRSRRALRCTILHTLLQEDYRGFSCQLASNPLYQWFCGIDALDAVRVPSKSQVQRFAHWLPAGEMRSVIEGLLRGAIEKPSKLGLREALDLEEYLLDSTCLKANVHFSADWVLLRDGVRTLMKATLLIRKAGLRRRMVPTRGVSAADESAEHSDVPADAADGQQEGAQASAAPDEEAGGCGARTCAAASGIAGPTLGADRVDATAGRPNLALARRGAGALAPGVRAGARADHRRAARGQRGEDLESL